MAWLKCPLECFILSFTLNELDTQESGPTLKLEAEEGHLHPETEAATEVLEEAEPDSGLGDSSVEGGESHLNLICSRSCLNANLPNLWPSSDKAWISILTLKPECRPLLSIWTHSR